MSTIKSSTEHLTLNADGSGKDIKFQANGVEKASISSAGVMTATSFAGDGSALTGVGKVLQVVSTAKNDTFSNTANAWTAVTGLSVSITPSSTSSKVLVTISVMGGYDDGGTTSRRGAFSIFRDGVNLIVPTTPGSRIGGIVEIMENVRPYGSANISYTFEDSPATTSEVTYAVYVKNHGGSPSVVYVNRGTDDEDSTITARGTSQIIAQEVSV